MRVHMLNLDDSLNYIGGSWSRAEENASTVSLTRHIFFFFLSLRVDMINIRTLKCSTRDFQSIRYFTILALNISKQKIDDYLFL